EHADGDLARRSVERLAREPAALVGEPHDFAAAEHRWGGDIGTVDPDVTFGEAIDGALGEHDRRLIGRRSSDAAEHGLRPLHPARRWRTWPDVAGGARAVLEALEAARFFRGAGRIGQKWLLEGRALYTRDSPNAPARPDQISYRLPVGAVGGHNTQLVPIELAWGVAYCVPESGPNQGERTWQAQASWQSSSVADPLPASTA